MELDVTGRRVLVTGGGQGIGRGIVLGFAAAGAEVVVNDIDAARAGSVVDEVTAAGGRAAAAVFDVTDHAAVRSGVDGVGGVDVLVNNAGIYPFMPLTQMSEADFMRVIDVNLRGVFLCTKAVAQRMIEQGRGGGIVNVTSVDAVHPSMIGLAHYDASKHGVWGFTKNVALELAPHRIWVNAIAPGGILTPGVKAAQSGGQEEDVADVTAAIPMGRLGDPDEIGRVAVFLASELASYMTGSQVVADGGMLLT